MDDYIICSDSFNYKESNAYEILAQVWEYSVKKHNPNAKIILSKYKAPDLHGVKRSNVSNTVKIKNWLKIMEENPDKNIIFMDCDMLVLGDLSTVFENDFDFAVTKHSIGNLPYNGGFVAAKGNDNAKKFMRLWVDVNEKMFKNSRYHAKFIKKYAGMNQAALGGVLEEFKNEYTKKRIKGQESIPLFIDLPCGVWNLCRGYWKNVKADSKVVHIKSELRTACLCDRPSPETETCYKLWKQYKSEAGIDEKFNGTKKTIVADAVKKKVNHNLERINNANSYKYKDYKEYLSAQKEATERKAPTVKSWSLEGNIKYISAVLRQLNPSIKMGICHGSRNGDEQTWFKKYTLGANVIGSDICPSLKDVPNTVIWDFNKENKEWVGKMDFIFTNCFDHVYNPMETLLVWIGQLTNNGRLIIEYTVQHEATKPSKSDPYKFSRTDLINLVKTWTNGEYVVFQFIQCPQAKMIQKRPQIVEYAVIEKVGLR